MEGKYTIFDTIVVGAVFILWFVLGLHFVMNPACFSQKIDALKDILVFKNDLTGKLLVTGIIAHVLGAILQVVSIYWFPRPWKDDPARKCLQNKVLDWIDHYNARDGQNNPVCREARQCIRDADPDSIFAWVHYSDPRTELIEWGRRKLRYVYLAENWMVAIVTGYVLGLLVGAPIHYSDIVVNYYTWSFYFVMWQIFLIPIIIICMKQLYLLREENKRYDNGMIAMYVTGRAWDELEKNFLPKSREKYERLEGQPSK